MEKLNTGLAQKSRITGISQSFSSCLQKAEKLSILSPAEQLNIMRDLERQVASLSQMLKIAKSVAETGEDHERVVSC